jgi:threonyl-tRNA synthetase
MSDTVSLTFPDGVVKTFPSGITGAELAASISQRLGREALSITLNGEIRDLSRPITADGTLKINLWDDEDGQETFWHSSAHLMAEAIQAVFPDTKFAIGPPIATGFYYDMDFGDYKLTEADLAKIETKMIDLARTKSEFVRKEVPKADAIAYFAEKQDPYKLELLNDLTDGTITFYTQGEFTDLCRGPHIPNTEHIKAVKLLHIAGAYWRGNSDNKQLTRVYGVTFPKKSLLDEHLIRLEEAKKRDHKKLGKELQLFMFSPMVGRGLPVWLPNGTIIRRELEAFLRTELIRRGYQEVITPHIGNLDMYRMSGHYPYYADSQFAPITVEDEEYLLKPMNCPHHHQIYSNQPRSYRDLPVRLAEFGTVYRYEQSGELTGLTRVRGFTQDDAHIYCSQEQLKDELKNAIELTQLVFKTFGMPVKTRLSFWDPQNKDKYAGTPEMWENAQRIISEVSDEIGLDSFVGLGEAAFYGPKFDFIVEDAIGRKWQLGTVQVDYVMPERFDLTFVGSDNKKHRPVIIHRAPFGSMERFTSILIEHFAGNFPLWMSPVQVVVMSMNDNCIKQATQYRDQLRDLGIRADSDLRNEQIGAKIREAENQKVPYMLVLGDKERAEESVNVRRHKKGQVGNMKFSDFISMITEEIATKRLPE